MSSNDDTKPVAGNGLLHRGLLRRRFLAGSAATVGSAGLTWLTPRPADGQSLEVPAWTTTPGAAPSAYGARSRFEQDVERIAGFQPGAPGAGASRTPLERLEGIITPNALHFERHHNGIPDIDPSRHRLLIHGLVDRPLIFDLDALSRYPLVSRVRFIECSGNSRSNIADDAPQLTAGGLHGLLSCAEWTGVPLNILLDEAGVRPEARWVAVEGADAAAMVRSVPLEKALDDAIVALYQNGERLRPSNGYPLRLLLPGWEGNINVKWLRRIQVLAEPAMARDETSKYSDLGKDGRASLFTFEMGVKSVITSPSGVMQLQGPGLYQISGLAWSGAGRIRRVQVSADGGATWAEAALTEPVLDKALTRFRLPWRWDGGSAVLMSRAVDESGATQPTRGSLLGERGPSYGYHYHAMQAWQVTAAGGVSNVHV